MANSKLKKKRSYKRRINKKVDVIIEKPKEIIDEPFLDRVIENIRENTVELETTEAQPQDRMMRYTRNPKCPRCDAHPVVCMIRRPEYKKFRCRTCGYQFEVKD